MVRQLTPEEEQRFAEGVRLFNEGRYWHAHEAWEDIWKMHSEDGRIFFQGLIQLAAGYHQLGRNILRGFIIHLRQAREKLALFPEDFLGVSVLPLLHIIDENLRMIEAKDRLEEIEHSKMAAPRIQFVKSCLAGPGFLRHF